MADKAPWRQEIELLQNYQKHATFTHTTTGSTVETALNLAGKMEEGNKVSFVVERLQLRVPTTVALLPPAGSN